ncbi:transglycosylase SLT domain-containing protein [Vibrio alginolyticus]|uniref:transglycosylase SLT domain-containing protein n=1 Tax=Vibrio TaxID=662 RepID=UPI001CDBF5F6|nr:MULTISPECIES: transglycosylase SLT domain-containing protein [Vibrio]MCA2452746.1 transglycosylase SLT domain-containing protein [Vibrio alginolyticus]MDW2232748.1 transglycosylase SLT domain-containing protein [Vibrio sp. 2091]
MLPFIADMPPLEQERVVCSISAAAKYEVPANIVLAVAEKESGKPGQWVKNSNGTHDVGFMQFNTAYLRDLKKYGITAEHVAASGCYPFDLAAWRLRGHILKDSGDLWTRAANYHSRTPKYNQIYRADLMKKAIKWADWLDENFTTVDVTAQGGKTPSDSNKMRKVLEEAVKIEVKYNRSERQEKKGAVNALKAKGYVPRTISFN